MDDIHAVLQQLRETMPPLFAGSALDQLTAGGYRWRSLQNEKSLGTAPADMFIRSGNRKLLVIRDKFLEFWKSKLSSGEARR